MELVDKQSHYLDSLCFLLPLVLKKVSSLGFRLYFIMDHIYFDPFLFYFVSRTSQRVLI